MNLHCAMVVIVLQTAIHAALTIPIMSLYRNNVRGNKQLF